MFPHYARVDNFARKLVTKFKPSKMNEFWLSIKL